MKYLDGYKIFENKKSSLLLDKLDKLISPFIKRGDDKPKVLKESSEEVEKLKAYLMLDEDIQWVKDALLELTDVGYNVNIRTYSVYGVSHPGLSITIDGKLLPIDIGEYLLTIHSYLSERGYFGFEENEYNLDSEDEEYDIDRSYWRRRWNSYSSTRNRDDSVGVCYYKPNKKVNESKHSGVCLGRLN